VRLEVVDDFPARALERLFRLEAFERALDAHKNLLVEQRDGLVHLAHRLADLGLEAVEAWRTRREASEERGRREREQAVRRRTWHGNDPADEVDVPVLALSTHEEVILDEPAGSGERQRAKRPAASALAQLTSR